MVAFAGMAISPFVKRRWRNNREITQGTLLAPALGQAIMITFNRHGEPAPVRTKPPAITAPGYLKPIPQFALGVPMGGANQGVFAAAVATAKRVRAKLVVAKLDRLSRNVAFIAQLMESGVEFVAADMPQANQLTMHVMAAFAEYEREAISTRTKDALAAAKARGVKLGGPHYAEAARIGAARNREAADQFAANIRPLIRELQANGVTTYRAIAQALSLHWVPTARGGSGRQYRCSTSCGGQLHDLAVPPHRCGDRSETKIAFGHRLTRFSQSPAEGIFVCTGFLP
jgi:hypothetical protein